MWMRVETKRKRKGNGDGARLSYFRFGWSAIGAHKCIYNNKSTHCDDGVLVRGGGGRENMCACVCVHNNLLRLPKCTNMRERRRKKNFYRKFRSLYFVSLSFLFSFLLMCVCVFFSFFCHSFLHEFPIFLVVAFSCCCFPFFSSSLHNHIFIYPFPPFSQKTLRTSSAIRFYVITHLYANDILWWLSCSSNTHMLSRSKAKEC